MSKYKKCKEDVMEKYMKKYEGGKLMNISDKPIKNRKQALAIALSQSEKLCADKFTRRDLLQLKKMVDNFLEGVKCNLTFANIRRSVKIILHYRKNNKNKAKNYEIALYRLVLTCAKQGVSISNNIYSELAKLN